MILERIRSRTIYVHRRLEENSILSKLTQKSFSLPEYVSVLQKFYGFIIPIETQLLALSRLDGLLPDLNRRLKSPLLRSDISKLSDQSLTKLINCPDLPEVNTPNKAIGYLYVMEGSTLGGKIISESIKTTLNILPETGGSYFFNYGPERGMMWKNFINHLNSYYLTEVEEEIVTSAENTFLKLESWLNQ
jgi:heme oxygenase (biliverdin-IX-beta and delta-forming)